MTGRTFAGDAPAVRARHALWVGAGGAVLVFAVATMTRADPDLWGHVRFGLDTLRSHDLPSVDPYSFTQDRPWINHEWLSELVMALSYTALASSGLALLKGALAFSAFVLVWLALRGLAVEARMILMAVVVIGTIGITETLRPHLWTLVCVATLVRILAANRSSARRWLPLLFALWTNLHGGWILGLGIVAAWALADMAARPSARREWLAIALACGAATLCSPYGWKLWVFLAETVRPARPMIEEWQPLWRLPPVKWVPWLLTLGAGVWAARRPFPQRAQRLTVLAVLAVAALRVLRIGPFFVESSAMLLAPALIRRWPRRTVAAGGSSRHDAIVTAGLCAGMFAASIWVGSTSLTCVAVDDVPGMPDAKAAPFLSSATEGRLVTFFNWGEYAIWHWGPHLRVSMDGRRETVYSDARLVEHDAILDGSEDGLATLARWKAQYVWLPASSGTTRRWLADHSYRIDVQTDRSFIAVRADLPRLVATDPSEFRSPSCFPG